MRKENLRKKFSAKEIINIADFNSLIIHFSKIPLTDPNNVVFYKVIYERIRNSKSRLYISHCSSDCLWYCRIDTDN